VNQISGVAIEKLRKKLPVEGYTDVVGESFDQTLHSDYLTINHIPGIAQHYSRVIVVIDTAPASHMTAVYFPREGFEFSTSIMKKTNDMSAYHLPIEMRFDGIHTIPILDFVTYLNKQMRTNFTPQTTLYEIIRAVLQMNYCIAYINTGIHSWSLQSFARNTLSDYIPKPIDISGVINSSIKNLENLPPIQNNNPASAPPPPSGSHRGSRGRW
jgi:hypothetical protein